jgi:cytochrome P450
MSTLKTGDARRAEHTKWRQLLGPLFSPSAIAKPERDVRARFLKILDAVATDGSATSCLRRRAPLP